MQAAPPPGVHHELVAGLLGGGGSAPLDWRRAAFDNADLGIDEVRAVVGKVATDPTRVTDDDFTRMGTAGLTGDQMWEVVICAAVGEASRQYESALSALAAAADGQP